MIQDKDVALLTLETRVQLTPFVQPVQLTNETISYENYAMTVAGWGLLKEGSKTQPSRLQKVDVNVWSNDKCQKSYGTEAPAITGNMMCASTSYQGGIIQDSCSVSSRHHCHQ